MQTHLKFEVLYLVVESMDCYQLSNYTVSQLHETECTARAVVPRVSGRQMATVLLHALKSSSIPSCAATKVYRNLLGRKADFYLIQEFTLSSKHSFRLAEPSYLVSLSRKLAKPLFNNCNQFRPTYRPSSDLCIITRERNFKILYETSEKESSFPYIII